MALRYLSTGTIAEAAGVSRRTVARDIKSGILPAVDIATPGSTRPRWRVAEHDLQGYKLRVAAIRETPLGKSA